MTKHKTPEWILSDEWAVALDTHNWILQQQKGQRWRSVGYHPTPEQLLQSLFRRVCRTEPKQHDLIEHIKGCLTAVEACTTRLSNHIQAELKQCRAETVQPIVTTMNWKQVSS